MNVDTGQFRALTAQVAELAEQVEQLTQQALMVRSLDELRLDELERRGLIFSARTRAGRHRHLRAVDGGAS